MNKKWRYKSIDSALVDTLVNEYGMTYLAAVAFQSRMDLVSNDLSKLKGTAKSALHDPFLMKDMDLAVERIRKAVESNEKITVFGDYDADGITSTAMLYTYLKEAGALAEAYIPERHTDGYGINKAAIDKIKSGGTSLIITVDNGIAALSEIDYATRNNIDVIVTDHHRCKDEIPKCRAVLNPKQPDCGYPFKELCGAGIVFKLICAISGEDIGHVLKKYSPFAAVGTIADIVPITDENRSIVKFGLKYLENCQNKGLSALIKSCGFKNGQISVGNVAFSIVPRINAAGRIDSASKALSLLLENDPLECLKLAQQLCEANAGRQEIEKAIFDEACSIIEEKYLHENKFIVLASEKWHGGVVGIVASKLVDRYYRPAILLCVKDGVATGSGRSITGIDLFDTLGRFSSQLLKFGGHSMAAGMSVEAELIDKFSSDIIDYVNKNAGDELFVQNLDIDCELENEYLTLDQAAGLEILKPHGTGNAAPVFSFSEATVKNVSTMSDGKHLRLLLKRDKASLTAVGFGMGNIADFIKTGDTLSVAGNLDINKYNGNETLQLMLKDIIIN